MMEEIRLPVLVGAGVQNVDPHLKGSCRGIRVLWMLQLQGVRRQSQLEGAQRCGSGPCIVDVVELTPTLARS